MDRFEFCHLIKALQLGEFAVSLNNMDMAFSVIKHQGGTDGLGHHIESLRIGDKIRVMPEIGRKIEIAEILLGTIDAFAKFKLTV